MINNLYSTGSTSVSRAWLGFFLAPLLSSMLVVGIIVLGLMIIMPDARDPSGMFEIVTAYFAAITSGVLLVGAPFTYLGMLLIGAPSWLVLRYTNNESGIAYTLVGAAGGWWLGPVLGGHYLREFPMGAVGAAGGAIALFLFWRIARLPVGDAEALSAFGPIEGPQSPPTP